MDKIINIITHILLIELATRTHSYFISSMECDTFIQMYHATCQDQVLCLYDISGSSVGGEKQNYILYITFIKPYVSS